MSARRSQGSATAAGTPEKPRPEKPRRARHAHRSRSPRLRARAAALTAVLATATVTALLPGLGGVDHASAATIEGRALSIAESKHGDPYRWGAAGPNAFDCSGLTYYAFRHAGHALPRTAQQQYDHVRHLTRSQLNVGDLVFFHSGGYVYHVGIYAGNNRIWHAPHTGAVVRLERIWTSAVWFGRIG